jgi:hypothetical protein
MESTRVTQEELKTIQELNTEFSQAKLAIGDIELQKLNIFQHIDKLKLKFSAYEKQLIEKYGEDSIINLQTGDLTKKEK